MAALCRVRGPARRLGPRCILVALLLLAILRPVAAWAGDGGGGGDVKLAGDKPNIILIMTDDQDLHLASLDYQPFVKKHFLEKGTWFRKHFCTVSLCCPSRVSMLTGRTAHNTNVTDVDPPHGGYSKFVSQGLNQNYLPVWLQEAGYQTYYAGKLVNGHSIETYDDPPAAGWTGSEFLLDPGTYIYYNTCTTLDNKPPVYHPGQYSTDLLAARSLDFLNRAVSSREPFFLTVAPIGPHSETILGDKVTMKPPVPAVRHEHLFPHVKVPRNPNFNPALNGTASYFSRLPPLSDQQLEHNDIFYRRRLQALQSVDELVDSILTRLEAEPELLANTYLFYTTDNGFHIGQHRLPPGKTCSIDEDINIPFIARGPGIAAGASVSFPTTHTDLVPTIFRLAGIPLHPDFDGEPIPLTEASQKKSMTGREHVLVEFWGLTFGEGLQIGYLAQVPQNGTYKALRIVAQDYEFSYTVWCTNEQELYDIKTDPFRLHDLYGSQSSSSGFSIPRLTARLDGLLLTLKNCKGRVCRNPWELLFPSGEVASLGDAMNEAYDHFFMEELPTVTFASCQLGYLLEAEGALGPFPYQNLSSAPANVAKAATGGLRRGASSLLRLLVVAVVLHVIR